MRIISTFKDYYDSVQAYGQDKSLIYLRKKDRIEIKEKKVQKFLQDLPRGGEIRKKRNSGLTETIYYSGTFIGFCGQFYPCIYFSKTTNEEEKIAYSLEQVIEFGADPDYGYPFYSIKELFNLNNKILNDLFVKYKTPIITFGWEWNDRNGIRDWYIETNSSLKDWHFQKIKDPFTAFQEISMFISGVLGTPEKEMIKISDNDMRDKKGFDKWSFRKKVR